jgi:hypothetical protein
MLEEADDTSLPWYAKAIECRFDYGDPGMSLLFSASGLTTRCYRIEGSLEPRSGPEGG